MDQLEQIVTELPRGPETTFDAGPPQIQLMAVQAAVGRLGWGTMLYVCQECNFEWDIWMTLGVEGPAALREQNLFLASPFSLGRCYAWPRKYGELSQCDGELRHDRRPNRDQEFDAPRSIPDDAPRFVLPHGVWRGDSGARLEVPEPALVAARRWHTDRQEEENPYG